VFTNLTTNGREEKVKVRTDEVGLDEPCYDYYCMKPGRIIEFDKDQPREDRYFGSMMQGSIKPWFTFEHTDGTRQYLNGQRICSLAYAKRNKYPGANT
jgi:hypothetical protein